jgi:hypothetical protein
MNAALANLRTTLDQLDARAVSADAVAQQFRAAVADWPNLPPRYGQVLERLLQPLDTAAMLGEESCSFSLGELSAALRQWLDHAAQLPR